MAEMVLTERASKAENAEVELKALHGWLYPEQFVPLASDDDPFAGTEYEGLAPPWA